MKKLLALAGCLVLVAAFSGIGLAGSELGSKMEGNLHGEIVKIKGDMVDIKDNEGAVHSVHVDPKSTKKTGELKVGAKVGADVNEMGHANSIWVEESKKK